MLIGHFSLALIAPLIAILFFAVFIPIYAIFKLSTDKTWTFGQIGRIGIIIGVLALGFEIFADIYWNTLHIRYNLDLFLLYLLPFVVGIVAGTMLFLFSREISFKDGIYVGMIASGLMFSWMIFSFFKKFVIEELYLDIFLILFIVFRYFLVVVGSFLTVSLLKIVWRKK